MMKKNENKSFYNKLISGDDKPLMTSNVVNDTLPFRDETDTQLKHANLIAKFEISDQATNHCCSCERLLRNNDMTSIRLSDNFGVAWDNLSSILHRTIHLTNSKFASTARKASNKIKYQQDAF